VKKSHDASVDNLPVGIYTLVSPRGEPLFIRQISQRALDLFGVSRSMVEAQASAMFTHLHPDDREGIFPNDIHDRRGVEPFLAEARFQVEGRQRWLRMELWPQSGPAATEWFGCVTDVTDRHEAEACFRTLFEHSPLAIAIHDPETGEILDANRAGWEFHGLDSFAALKTAFSIWVDKSFKRDKGLARIHAAAAGDVQRFKWRVASAQGRYRWFQVHLMPIVIAGQLRVLATLSDISETKAAQQRFEAIFKQSPIAQFVQDAESGEILAVNEQIARLYGYASSRPSPDSSTAREVDPTAPSDAASSPVIGALEGLSEAVAAGGSRFAWRDRHASGRDIWLDVSLEPLELAGRPCVLAACLDITAQREASLKLKASESRFRRILQDIDGVAVQGYRLDGAVSYWNRASEALYGYSAAEARASTLFDLIIPDFMRDEVRANVSAVGEGGEIPNGELELMRKDGSLVPVYSSHTVLRNPGSEPELFCIDIDLSERKAHEEALDVLANYDSLTGLPNRHLMADLIERMMARVERSQDTFALCYLDLDDFKPINDRHGHNIGDQVLKAIAQRLRRLVRGSDLVARLGGDEFVIVLDGIGEGPELDRRLHSLLEGVAAPVLVDRLELQVNASVGVTLYPADAGDPDALLRHADQAMYRAKSQGRNRYMLFDVELESRVRQRRERLDEIGRGLDDGQFLLSYQPKVNLDTGEVASLEGLVRWHRSQTDVRLPMTFLPELDGSDLEVRLGEVVIDQALSQLCEWARSGLELTVSVNVSGPHLLSDGFVAMLRELLARRPDCRPQQLILEILESAAVYDLDRAIRVLTDIRELGVQVSLDDFGTGYSSLSHLRSLPVDEVKVDQSFVRDMLEDVNDHNIVRGVISLAAAFSLRVVAEGVETPAHIDALRSMGCHLGQGYAFARPMPATETLDWLRHQSVAPH
jgi:diguanylate cyclase (GGDEF)-like protein/PAS domain S-box-containing protein